MFFFNRQCSLHGCFCASKIHVKPDEVVKSTRKISDPANLFSGNPRRQPRCAAIFVDQIQSRDIDVSWSFIEWNKVTISP